MAVYEYTARDAAGNEVSSVYTNVESVRTLRRELVKLGYELIRARRRRGAVARTRGRIRQRDVASFAYKFGGMYSAGLSITSCLEILEQQTDNPAFQSVLADVRRRVESGSSLKAAFEEHRGVFSDFFLGMIDAGESAGKLTESLDASARYLEKRMELHEKTRAAFIYPMVVGVVCSLVVLSLLMFVVPMFSQLYRRLHVDLPGPTQALVTISGVLRTQWWLLAPCAAGAVLGIRRLLKRPAVRLRWDRFKMRLPLIGRLSRLVLVSQFIRTFGMLISVGVPIIEALESAGQVARNEEMTRITADLMQSIRTGHPVAKSLQAHEIFPPMVIQLAASGEEAGILPEMLVKAADLLDRDADRLAASLLVKLEPALTILMGIAIGLILMGVYLPMFDYMACLK
ncbi:MAG: type II secretion system F family protein [Phycisphaerales bacterium]|jgi:type IV pilus assembly protein PilC